MLIQFLILISSKQPLFHSSDSQEVQVYQQRIMESAILTHKNRSTKGNGEIFFDYLLQKKGRLSDCCTWRGVACVDGVVTSLAMRSPYSGPTWSLSVEWLPQTIRHMHLHFIGNERKVPFRCLPRDLRYLYKKSGFEFVRSRTDVLEIRDLPAHMEELRLIPSRLAGTFDVQWLPQTMRIFVLEDMFLSLHLEVVVRINNAGLPDGFECMSVYSKKVKILPFAGKKADPRVKKVASRSEDIKSEYYQKCYNLSFGRK